MCELFERALVTHCAPTLAGHKCGSLFTWVGCPGVDPSLCVAEADALLRHKGCACAYSSTLPDRSLIYAYRPNRLRARLSFRPGRAQFFCGIRDTHARLLPTI